MSSMVERVARAIEKKLSRTDPYDERQHKRFNYDECARAAIAAMREPTEGMLAAGAWELTNEYVGRQWQAMIDAALEGK